VIYVAAGAINCGIRGMLGKVPQDPSVSLELAFSAGAGPFPAGAAAFLCGSRNCTAHCVFFGGVSAAGAGPAGGCPQPPTLDYR
jgi:hypothetical protein